MFIPSRPSLTRRHLLALTGAAAAAAMLSRNGVLAQDNGASARSLGWTDEFGSNDLPNIATTVAPISSMVRNVAGTRINLRGVIPDGTDSHTFEPAPSDAKILANANILIANGLMLETPTIDLAEANLPDGAEVFTLGDKAITEAEYVYDFSFPEEEGKPNPHLWMNVALSMTYCDLIAAKLSELYPDDASSFAENLTRYKAVLTKLDEAIFAAVQTVPEQNRKILTYHDSYAYFAPRYGMTVIGAAQPSDFSEPSPQEVAALIDQIKEEQVPAVFGSEVYPSPVLEQIAKESGAVYVDKLRDDEPPGEPNAPEHTYIGMMLYNMNLMIPALGGTVEAFAGIEPFDTYLP